MNPRLYVSIKYFPCTPLAGIEGVKKMTEETASEVSSGGATANKEDAEVMGILMIKSIELSGTQTNAGMNLGKKSN